LGPAFVFGAVHVQDFARSRSRSGLQPDRHTLAIKRLGATSSAAVPALCALPVVATALPGSRRKPRAI
ncbi:MAG: hypothetical protein RR283_00825, partial [Comamonas sp.]